MKSDNGLFLTIEGPPQSGRTTHADALAAALTADGYDVVRVSPPPIVGRVIDAHRAWLAEYIDGCVEIARTDVHPAMDRGAVVIADGWITSAMLRAHAGTAIATHALARLWAIGTREVCPDVEFLLSASASAQGKQVMPSVRDWHALVTSQVRGHHPAGPLLPRAERRIYTSSETDTRDAIVARTHAILKARASEVPEGQEPWSTVVAEDQYTRHVGHAHSLIALWLKAKGAHLAIVDIVNRWATFSPEVQDKIVSTLPMASPVLAAFANHLAHEGITSTALDVKYDAAMAQEMAEAAQKNAEAEEARRLTSETAPDAN